MVRGTDKKWRGLFFLSCLSFGGRSMGGAKCFGGVRLFGVSCVFFLVS